ncbi:MAG: succinate dehydrogenase cytochrome b subunit [Cytophagales bacterium]
MSWILNLFLSTLGRKLIVALTGLFLILFLAVHVSGNFTLLKGDGGEAFNAYSEFMSANPLIQTVAWLTKIFIVLHVVQTIMLTIYNRKARPEKYAFSKPGETSTWSSRNMMFLGSIILIFLILHLKTFWYEFHYGNVPMTSYDTDIPDYYAVVAAAFSELWYVLIYLVALIGLSFHLWHGFQSSFQTLGLNHPRYNPLIHGFGALFAILVPLGFATQPIYLYLIQM